MSTETEVKIRIDDPGRFRAALTPFTPQLLSGRHFEDNILVDFADQRLRRNQCLLRVRFAGGRGVLTYKGPPAAEGIFKTREELETDLADGSVMLEILERIGMVTSFRYQKYRQEFQVDGTHIAIDETPIGNYAELEGTEEGIREIALKLNITEAQFIRSSYYSLYLDYCREKGMAPGSMVF